MNNSNPEEVSTPVLSPDRQKKAAEYAGISRRLSFAELVLLEILLLVLVFSGFSSSIASFLDMPPVLSDVVYALIMIVVYTLLTAPFSCYRSFVLNRRYGLSAQGFSGWLADFFQSGALTALLVVSIVAVAYWVMGVFPGTWWLVVWGILEVVSLALSILLPVVLVPMFYKTKPLVDEDLKERFRRLAGKAGASIDAVYTIEFSSKQTTANAALMGLGRTKRVVLSDTILKEYSPEEIEAVIAHELGHYKNRDFISIFVYQSVILFLSIWLTCVIAGAAAVPLGFSGISDVAALPLIFLTLWLVNTLFTPVSNTIMRRFEKAADDFALRLTGNPQAFISMMTKLTEQNLDEARPPRLVEVLTHDHPSYYNRVADAAKYVRDGREKTDKE